MSYEDVKSVAKDTAMRVFKENAAKLTQEAHEIAYARAEEFTENFLSEVMATRPAVIHEIGDPGVQSAIFEAQSSYASAGDADLGNLLVSLLVDRMGTEERNLTQLALSSAVSVAKDLRSAHFSLLSCNLFLKGAQASASSIEELAHKLDEALYPLVDALHAIHPQEIDYLMGRGCVVVTIGEMSIARYLRMSYPGLFTRGFNNEWPEARFLMDTPLVEPHPQNPGNYRLAIVTNSDLETLIRSYELEHLRDTAAAALEHNVIGDTEIESLLVSASPRLANLFSRWSILGMQHCLNTATGHAIGHAHLRNIGVDVAAFDQFV
ncbi:LPO_1073/Vpar_1526 family protein [Streptomyces nigra]|uniref:Uncharacterized protein n=1 Tax=Streptomyces nigra TaxID=1827580 RepID=A0ABZ1ISL5_9ACTN